MGSRPCNHKRFVKEGLAVTSNWRIARGAYVVALESFSNALETGPLAFEVVTANTSHQSSFMIHAMEQTLRWIACVLTASCARRRSRGSHMQKPL